YTTSSDLDTIAVTPTNTAPTLTVPAGPIVEEATSPAGATLNFVVSASDLEDEPDPVPSCDWSSGATFPLGATTVTCSVVDSGRSMSFDVAQTLPSSSSSLARAMAATGWWNAATGAPTVTWSCGDTGSGLASCTPPSTFGEGAGQSATGTAMDVAGNAKVGTVSGVNVDLTPPGPVSLIGGGLTEGASYGFGHVPAGPTGCSSVDTLSGLASCQVSGYATSVGWHTLTGMGLGVAVQRNNAS